MDKKIIFAIAGFLLLAPAVYGLAEEHATLSVPNAPSLPQPFQPLSEPQPSQESQQAPVPSSGFQEFEEDKDSRDFVNPQEVSDALRQLEEIQTEARRLLRRIKKLAGAGAAASKINEILNQTAELEKAIKNPPAGMELRGALQDFYDAEVWETLNEVRASVELPTEIKRIEKDLRRLEKLVNSKTFAVEKVDMNLVKLRIEEIKKAVGDAQSELAQGNFEEARDFLEMIHDGANPGEIIGVLNQLREISRQTKRLKLELKNSVYEILEPVIASVHAGDFREANEIMNEISQELWRLVSQLQSKRTINADLRRKIDQLETKIQEKLESLGGSGALYGPQSRLERYNSYKASFLESIYFNFLDLFE